MVNVSPRVIRRLRPAYLSEPLVARRGRGLGAVAAIAACTLIAACGSGSSAPSTSSSSGGHPTAAQIEDRLNQQVLRFAGCMRSHGVPNFPDPTSPGADKEFLLGQIPGLNQSAPAFRSAHSACEHLLPSNGPNTQRATAEVMAQLLHTARCLRAHGLTGFPDPTASPPSNQAAYGDVIAFGAPHGPPGAPPVAYLAIPNSINPNSPAAEHAASACNFRLQ